MVMDKKGFLKILEAIVAILIVLGFVIALMPSQSVSEPKLPPDLEQTTNSILIEIQENPEFRGCIFGRESDYFGDSIGVKCVYDYINYITHPSAAHFWEYGIRICVSDGVCDFFPIPDDLDLDGVTEETFALGVLPSDKNVYIRSISISVEDVLGEGVSGEETISRTGVNNVLTIFAWSKI